MNETDLVYHRQPIFSKALLIGVLLLSPTSCSSEKETEQDRLRRLNQKGEYIYREHHERLFAIAPPKLQAQQSPLGNTSAISQAIAISKEHFRCKGSSINPARIEISKSGETQRYPDCEGGAKHSLPIVKGKEFIYPILIDLLTEINVKTGMPIIITSGHRCPIHNLYVDSGAENRACKHQIGAEVDFYVQGMEDKPSEVVQIILDYYRNNPKYAGDNAHQEFLRYDKGDSKILVTPWYNKEVFVKLFRKEEGRDLDNRHPYPYVSIQVRYDRDLKEKVTFSWEKAQHGYHRW